ncbi:ABC transporter transmembrane domain-containing protein [Bacillus cereus group sp. MYBK234-1]|uniref:ABC transporter transmembrane domain-containing protein n=1 Tax=unclassified Bacillus cereus group TaxID=2750818 RepID=UPI003F78F6EA
MVEKLKQYKEDFQAVTWILKTISIEWKTAVIVLICIVITSILGPLSPLVLKEIIDNGLQGTSKYSLVVLLMAFGILPVIYGMCNVMLAYFSNKLSEKTTNILQLDMYKRVMDKSLNFFITNKSGQILQRVVREPGEINSYLSAITIQFASKIFLLITTLITMFMLNVNLTIVSLLFVPLILIPGPFFSRWTVPIHIKNLFRIYGIICTKKDVFYDT